MNIKPNTKKILYFVAGILPIVIIALLGKPLTRNSTTQKTTVPIINNNNTYEYTPNSNIATKDQKIKIDLSKSITDIEQKPQNIYKIATPLVTESHIGNLISNLNFYPKDLIDGTPTGDNLWVGQNKSLFLSTNQNQIVYTDANIYQELSNTYLNTDEIKSVSIGFIQKLLGGSTAETLNTDPRIEFLYLEPNSIEGEPIVVTYDKANLIAASFNQKINGLPVITDSPNNEIIRIVINKNKKLADLRVYGGYLNIKEVKQSQIPSTSNIDVTRLHRTSYAKDISSEKLFSETKSITITADNISLAYYYQNNGFLSPVIVINGKMTTGKFTEPATFIHPIEPSSESL